MAARTLMAMTRLHPGYGQTRPSCDNAFATACLAYELRIGPFLFAAVDIDRFPGPSRRRGKTGACQYQHPCHHGRRYEIS